MFLQTQKRVNMTQNTKPAATDFEEIVLGALLIEGKAIDRVSDMLSEEVFYDPKHAAIYAAINGLTLKNEPIDLLTVTKWLRSAGRLDEAGGPAKVSELTNKAGSTANLEYHARVLQETYTKRQLIDVGRDLTRQGYEETRDVFTMLSEAESKIYDLSNPIFGGQSQRLGETIPDVLREIESASNNELLGVPSMIPDFDNVSSGYRPGDLNILAARPSQGKTQKALQEALQQSLNGYPVAFFSLEMNKSLLVKRALSNLATINTMKTNFGNLTRDEWQAIQRATGELEAAPFFVEDEPQLNFLTLKSKLRKLKEHGLRIAYVDYLQLMEPMRNHGTREQEISEISRGLKACATELQIPIVALSQLSREVDKREKPIPKLSDLRESGSLEQDASLVTFMYWPKAYNRQEEGAENELRLLVAKNRHGMTASVGVEFREEFGQFHPQSDPGTPGDGPKETTPF